jgi:hypothetical protein
MGSFYSRDISCDYCYGKINERTAIVKVYSMGKLDNMYLCNYCLIDKERRYMREVLAK